MKALSFFYAVFFFTREKYLLIYCIDFRTSEVAVCVVFSVWTNPRRCSVED